MVATIEAAGEAPLPAGGHISVFNTEMTFCCKCRRVKLALVLLDLRHEMLASAPRTLTRASRHCRVVHSEPVIQKNDCLLALTEVR